MLGFTTLRGAGTRMSLLKGRTMANALPACFTADPAVTATTMSSSGPVMCKSYRTRHLVWTLADHDTHHHSTTVGGTSASSPTFAAVIALVNDALIARGRPALGFLNPWIYGGAYKALTDMTSGSSIGCNSSGFPAEVGWDAVTGYGTPVSSLPICGQ